MAQTSRANLRPELTLWPCFIRKPESHPPAMEPKLAAVVDDDERVFDVVQVQVVVVVQEFGEIEEVEPPDGVGQPFADEKGPEATVAQQDRVDVGRPG